MTEPDINSIRNNLINKFDLTRNLSDEEIYSFIDNEIIETSRQQFISLTDKERLRYILFNSIRGYDVLQELLDDQNITEIMINGPDDIFIERNGLLEKSEIHFSSPEKLQDIIQQIVSEANRRVNEASPIADARLYDGSRVNIVLNPVALNGPAVTIRKFPDTPLSMNDLIQFGTLTHETADFLHLLVLSGYNIFVCGGTGSGKTTFLNVLSDFIPSSERVITIEDSAELQLHIPNIVKLEARQANTDGKNEITIRDLIRSSLRMRPNRIIVGEIRGAEALDMLTAFNTGHDGSMSTGHGNSPRDMLRRIETMVLMGVDMPVSSIKGQQISSGIDIIVHLGRLRDRSRRVLEITEIADFTDNEIILNPLYIFKESGSTQKVTGSLQKTGNSLKDITKIQMSGHTALLKEFL